MSFYHWTCEHTHDAIGDCGIIRPGAWLIQDRELLKLPQAPRWAAHLVWFTDIAEASDDARWALGLTSRLTSCDRMAYRYIARFPIGIVPWSEMRPRAPKGVAGALESAPGAEPWHWWCSESPVRVWLDQAEQAVA